MRRARRLLLQRAVDDDDYVPDLIDLATIHQFERELDAEDEFEKLKALGRIRP